MCGVGLPTPSLKPGSCLANFGRMLPIAPSTFGSNFCAGFSDFGSNLSAALSTFGRMLWAACVGGAVLVTTLSGCASTTSQSHPASRTAKSVSIVSGGNLGFQSDSLRLVASVDSALKAAAKASTHHRGGRGPVSQTVAGGTITGPPISHAGPACLGQALDDAGTQAGPLLYVADLTWQGVPSFLYAFRYAPRLVRRPGSATTNSTGPTHPTRLLLVVDDATCRMETATIFF
jgi:hypothetical protein